MASQFCHPPPHINPVMVCVCKIVGKSTMVAAIETAGNQDIVRYLVGLIVLIKTVNDELSYRAVCIKVHAFMHNQLQAPGYKCNN